MNYRIFTGWFLFQFVLFLAMAAAIAAPKWKDEVSIAAWCYDISTIEEIIKADAAGNPELGDGLATLAFNTGVCVRLPVPVAAFKPSGIAKAYPSFGGKPVTVVKGNLVMKDDSLGRVAYVVVPDDKLFTFQMGEAAKAPKTGPQYPGWQNI